MPPVIVSVINLKGGVGKTTTTVQLAECLVSEFGKKVLVIDLDPQTNATISLIDEKKWQELNEQGQTIAQMFLDKIEGTKRFELDKAVQHGVSNLKLKNLSLLPSSIDLIQVQDRMVDISLRTRHTVSPMEVLKFTVQSVLEQFDYVLIDCPPNLGYVTQNGIEISDYYLIPTIPDTLSTYGLPQIVKSISEFSRQRTLSIRCLGLVITKFDPRSAAHRDGLVDARRRFTRSFDDLPSSPGHLFTSRIPLSNTYAEGAEVSKTPTSFRQKWGYGDADGKKLHEHVTDLTKEFMTHATR